MEPRSSPQQLPQGKGNEQVMKDEIEVKVAVAEDTDDGEMEHGEDTRSPIEYYGKGKEKVEESDHELSLDVAEDRGKYFIDESEIEEYHKDGRMARESPHKKGSFMEYAKTLGAESSMAAQSRLTGVAGHGKKRWFAMSCCAGRRPRRKSCSTVRSSDEESAAATSSTSSPIELDRININHKCALYRVHSNLRDGSDKHYEPVLMSIGPYHHGKPALKGMEKRKEHFMKVLLKENSIDGYVDTLKNGEEEMKALHCYWDTHQMDEDSFGKCMVRDGFFLIELFRGTWTQDHRGVMIFNRSWMMSLLKRDMLLFENQIPLFVLRTLFALTYQTHDEYDHDKARCASMEERHDSDSNRKFVEQALGFFSFNHKPLPNLNLQPSQLGCIPHLLGLVYKAFVPKTPERPNNSPKSWEPIWTAVALEQVGVQFRPANDREAFYGIHFSDGVLSIPPLVIDDSTETFFRNLVAYEQYSNEYYTSQQVGNYLKVMDCLINSAKDVELLRHCRIINDGLGDDKKVSTMFNHILSGVFYDPETFFYAEMFNEVNKFCKKRRNVWIAKLKNKYFGSPWSVISFGAALLLLLLTAFQTGYSAASYYYQLKSQG